MPKKVQRNWASPDCGNYDTALIISRYFYLKSTADDMTLMPASLSSRKQDYFVFDLSGTDTPARLENDAILKIGAYAKESPRSPDNWDDLKLDDTEEFTGCLEAPAVVPKVLQRFMRYVDRIKDQCTVSVNNECAGVLFKMADENGDRHLSQSEIRRAVSSAVIFAALADKKTLTSQEALTLIHDSAPQAKAVADALLAAYDKDQSGTLDYNELMTDFHAPDLPIIKDTLEKAGTLLPPFKVAAMTLK